MTFPTGRILFFHSSKLPPNVKDWWETHCEKKHETESSLFSIVPTWNFFRDVVKEKYYPVGSYEDKYIQWTMLRQQRDQDVHELTNLLDPAHQVGYQRFRETSGAKVSHLSAQIHLGGNGVP